MQFTCGTRRVTLPTTNIASGTSSRGVKPSRATSHHHSLHRGHVAEVSIWIQTLRNLPHTTCTANSCCCPSALGHLSHGLQTTSGLKPKPSTILKALPSLCKRALSVDTFAKSLYICKEEDEECVQATFDAKGLEIEYSRKIFRWIYRKRDIKGGMPWGEGGAMDCCHGTLGQSFR